jgi:hypothetical protein
MNAKGDRSLQRLGLFVLRKSLPWTPFHYSAFSDAESGRVIVVGVESEQNVGSWAGTVAEFETLFVRVEHEHE